MNAVKHNGDLRGVKRPLEVLARRRTGWQLVEIVRHPVYGNQLLIDHDLQISEADFAYSTDMTAPVLTLARCRRAAILGGGDGGVLDELLRACDRAGKGLEQATLVDIDGEVVDLCRQWMTVSCGNAFEDPRGPGRAVRGSLRTAGIDPLLRGTLDIHGGTQDMTLCRFCEKGKTP